MGRIVSLDEKGEWDSTLESSELIPSDDLKEMKGLDEWITALYDQLRLVYADTHQQTLRMALAIRPHMAVVLASMGGVWEAENTMLIEVEKEILNRPYFGLREKLPVTHCVKSWPRCGYLRYKYKLANMTLPEDRVKN